MVSALIADFLPYILGLLAAVGGVLAYGRGQRGKGRREVTNEIEKADMENALDIKEKLDALDTDGDALERLRKHGKLRD